MVFYWSVSDGRHNLDDKCFFFWSTVTKQAESKQMLPLSLLQPLWYFELITGYLNNVGGEYQRAYEILKQKNHVISRHFSVLVTIIFLPEVSDKLCCLTATLPQRKTRYSVQLANKNFHRILVLPLILNSEFYSFSNYTKQQSTAKIILICVKLIVKFHVSWPILTSPPKKARLGATFVIWNPSIPRRWV